MTTVIANSDPTIQIGRDEKLAQHSNGLTVLFAESIYSAALSDFENDSVLDEAIAQNNLLVAEVVRKHQGQVSKAIGAIVVAEFADPQAAVHAAVDIERLMVESSQATSLAGQSPLKIAIHGLSSESCEIDLSSA